MSGAVPLIPLFKFTDAKGKPLALGWVTVYLAGTTTMATTYTDMALTVPHVNPLQLDANGEAVFWLDPSKRYKFQLQDSNLVTVPGWPVDNVQAGASARMTGIVDAADLGLVLDSPLDQSVQLQAAIDGAPTGGTLYVGPGTARYISATVSKPMKIRGAGKGSTTLRCLSATADGITVTTVSQVDFSDFLMDASVPRTAGAFIKVDPASGSNFDLVFRRLEFVSPFVGINLVDAADFTIDDCYFATYVSIGVLVADVASPDSGDSLIFNTTFDAGAGTGSAIIQSSGGGLRVLCNKFLGGNFHYLGQFSASTSTSIVLLQGNSSEHAKVANFALTASGGITFGAAIIQDNHITVSTGAAPVGISISDPGYDFLTLVTIGGNTINLDTNGVAMSLGRGINVSVLPNNIMGSAAGTTGIAFGANLGATTIHQQDMHGVATRYSGPTTNVTFVPGGMVQTGTNTDTTNVAYGTALFASAARAVVFATPYAKAPIVNFQVSTPGVSAVFTVVPSTTGFTYEAIGATNGGAVAVTWTASGG